MDGCHVVPNEDPILKFIDLGVNEEPCFGQIRERKCIGFGSKSSTRNESPKDPLSGDLKPKKRDKDVPIERSAKYPVSREKMNLTSNKCKPCDPRFLNICGDFNESRFRRNYRFVNEIREEEINTLKTRIGSESDLEEKDKIKRALELLISKKNMEERKILFAKVADEHMEEQKKRVTRGLAPKFLRKRELRKKAMIERYEQLKAQGKLNAYMKRKQKREASKSRVFIPKRRNVEKKD